MNTIIMASDKDGMALKEHVKSHLRARGHTVSDLNETPAEDFVEAARSLAEAVLANKDSLGMAFDAYGAGSFMVACKVKGIVAAEVSDERSAYMTREHNDARIICIGAAIVGPELAVSIAEHFVSAHYAGGRHQIRVDMLNRMA